MFEHGEVILTSCGQFSRRRPYERRISGEFQRRDSCPHGDDGGRWPQDATMSGRCPREDSL
jgi:hypothetical protein